METSVHLRIALLGPLEVALAGAPVTSFGYDKVRALLAYLAVEAHRPHSRAELAALLWPGEPEAVGLKNLRTALAILRQALALRASFTQAEGIPEGYGDTEAAPPFLLITRTSLRFNPDSDHTLDVAAIAALLAGVEAHAHAGGELCALCAGRLAQAVGLYRGSFLQTLTVPGSIAWEEWAMLIREGLHGRILDALARLIGHYEARGDDEAARQCAWRALALEPWDEAAHRCLMRAFAHAGRRAEALAQYERCRRTLADELGIEPAAETSALAERIRSGPLVRPAGAPPARIGPASSNGVATTSTPSGQAPLRAAPIGRAGLPAPPTPLIGREHDLAAVCARLVKQETRLLTMVGPPGVGKTRLAMAAAEALRGGFADGAAFVALAPLRDAALVGPTIARILGLVESGGPTPGERLQHALHGKELLLLLDNCEHVLDAAPLVAELLAACPRLVVLATSRAPLHIRAERLHPVLPLALPAPGRGPVLAIVAQAPAVRLFVERSAAVAPGFALSAANAETIVAICARLDGLPLALELAATHSAALTPEALLAQLERRLALLTDGPRDLPAHQRAMRSALGWSYELLAPAERELFACLGVFAGGCALAAIAAVAAEAERAWGAAGAPPDAVRQPVAALVGQHLVQQEQGVGGETRLALLEIVREYSLELLEGHGELEAARGRHARHYLELAEAAHGALRGSEVQSWLARLEQEHDNLRAALHWCGDAPDRAVLGLRLAGALWPFWQLRGYVGEGREWLRGFVEAGAGVEGGEALARALLGAGWLAYYQDDYEVAAAYGRQSLGHCDPTRSTAGQAESLSLLGFCAAAQGDYAGGIAMLEDGVDLGRASGDTYALALALLNLGFLHNDLGELDRAMPLFEEALQCGRQIGHPFVVARALNALGELARMRGAYAEAGPHYTQSLALYEQLGDRRGAAALRHNLGCVALHGGDCDAAQAHFGRSMALYRELDDPSGIAAALAGLAGVLGARGDPARGATLLGAAYATREAIGAAIIEPDRGDYERWRSAFHAQLGEEAFAAAWARGQGLSLERILAEAAGDHSR